jgi:hypothetical protein
MMEATRKSHIEKVTDAIKSAAVMCRHVRTLMITTIADPNRRETWPRRSERNWTMRKATAQPDPKQRNAVLYLADLGTAILSAALAVNLLRAIVNLI